MVSLATSNRNAPDHVPAELVWNHSLDAFIRELDDPHLAASRLHAGPSIIWAKDTAYGHPGWVLTRHALIQEAFLDYEHFASARANAGNAILGVDCPLIPLEFDPPEHHAYRQVLNPYFTPRVVSGMEARVQEVCDSLISKFADRGSCEFVGEFAAALPSHIFLALLGMSQAMAPQFLDWEQQLMRGTEPPKRVAAARAIVQYLKDFIAEQKLNPQTEVMQGIVSGHIKDRPLTDGEMVSMCYLLYIAGLDTVYRSLGWIMRHLAGDRALQQRLRANPPEIPLAIDELLRAYGLVSTHRTVVKDFSFHGVQMRKGDDVLLPTYLASRDPEAYENPHVVDIDRRPRSVTFGTGAHTCLGIHLAKREIRVAIETFLLRFNNIRIPPGETYRFCTGPVLGVDYLPLMWDR